MLVLEGLVYLHRTVQFSFFIQVCAPAINAEEAEVEWFCRYLQNIAKIFFFVSLDGKKDLAPRLLLAVSPWFPIPSLP